LLGFLGKNLEIQKQIKILLDNFLAIPLEWSAGGVSRVIIYDLKNPKTPPKFCRPYIKISNNSWIRP